MKRLKYSLTLTLATLYAVHGNCWSQAIETLPLANEVTKTIQPNEQHKYEIDLSSETYVAGYVKQKGANVNISVFAPDGQVVLFQDQQKNVDTVEPFGFSADGKGKYAVEITSLPGEDIAIGRDKNSFIWDGERRVPYETSHQEGSYSIYLAGENKGETFASRIEEVFRFYDKDDYPGAAVAVVRDGEVIYKEGFGIANLEYGVPITPSTVFHIASVSKQFAGFALATLHDEGKLSLDDDVRDYIPELQVEDKITIRQMLNHTSGLRDQWILLALAGWRMDDVITQEQLLKMIYRQEGLNFKPGEEYSYSNSNYTLAAEIVRRVSGKTLREWTTAHVFKPLGMDHTFFYDDHEEIVPNRAYSYDDRSGEVKKSVLSYANSGATSLFTTVADFSKWLINFQKPEVGNKSIFKNLRTKGVLNNGHETHYALGLASGNYKGHQVIDHSGVDAGYRSFMMYFPDEQLGIIVLSNIASCNTIELAQKVADIALDIEGKRTSIEIHHMETKAPYDELEEVETGELEDYVGTYHSEELDTRYHLFLKNGRLMASHIKLEDIELMPTGKDAFKGTYWIFNHTAFIRNSEGDVIGFKVTNGGVRDLSFRKL